MERLGVVYASAAGVPSAHYFDVYSSDGFKFNRDSDRCILFKRDVITPGYTKRGV